MRVSPAAEAARGDAAVVPCRIGGTSAQASLPHGAPLSITRESPPFADLRSARGEHLELTLSPDGDAARLDAQIDHVSFVVWTRRDAFLYEPVRPTALDGYFLPYTKEGTSTWSYARNGFHVEVAVPDGLRRVDGAAAFRATRSCEEMSLVGADTVSRGVFAVAAPARFDLDTDDTIALRKGASVPLSASPRGPVVGFLEPKRGRMVLQVRDAPVGTTSPSPELAYVAWDSPSGLVFGWAPRASFGPTLGDNGIVRCGAAGCGGRFAVERNPRPLRRCQSEVPIFVRASEGVDPIALGTALRDARLRTRDPAPPEHAEGGIFVAIEIVRSGLDIILREHTTFLVRAADLATCPVVGDAE